MKRGLLFGSILAAGIFVLTASTSNLREFSLQQALNLLAGNGQAPYTRYSAQQAANILVNRQIAEQDSMIGTVCFVIDDNRDDLWEDSLRWSPTGSLVKKTTRAICKEYGIVGGLSLEPHAILYGDSTQLLTPAHVTALIQNYGFEGGIVGYNEPASLYHGNTGLLAKGTYTKGMALFEYDIRRGYEASRDSLGVIPRWISWSNSSAAAVLKKFAVRYVEFGFCPFQTATVGGADGLRPNLMYGYEVARYGAWGTGSAGGSDIAAGPGNIPDRYEISQCLGESSDSSVTYKAIRRALQTRGLVVWIGHSFTTWENGLVSDGSSTNDIAKLFSYLKTLETAGRIRVVTPSEAADLYINAPLSPAVNYSTDNFQDLDGDTHVDWWFEGRGDVAWAAGDTALLLQKAGNVGHGGKRAMGLNWNGIASGAGDWDGQTSNAAWETPNAVLVSIPPAGGGWTVQFECWVIADTTVAGWNAGTAPQAGDSVGVLFGGPSELNPNRFAQIDRPVLGWGIAQKGGANNYGASISNDLFIGTAPPPFFKLTARNNLHRGANKEWLHLVASWDVPEFSDYVFISVWKAGNVIGGTNPSPNNGIVISDYHVSYHRRFPMTNGASLTRF